MFDDLGWPGVGLFLVGVGVLYEALSWVASLF
jgi:hypothetical protein